MAISWLGPALVKAAWNAVRDSADQTRQPYVSDRMTRREEKDFHAMMAQAAEDKRLKADDGRITYCCHNGHCLRICGKNQWMYEGYVRSFPGDCRPLTIDEIEQLRQPAGPDAAVHRWDILNDPEGLELCYLAREQALAGNPHWFAEGYRY